MMQQIGFPSKLIHRFSGQKGEYYTHRLYVNHIIPSNIGFDILSDHKVGVESKPLAGHCGES